MTNPREVRPGETLEWIIANCSPKQYEDTVILALAREALEHRKHMCDTCRDEDSGVNCHECCHGWDSRWEERE